MNCIGSSHRDLSNSKEIAAVEIFAGSSDMCSLKHLGCTDFQMIELRNVVICLKKKIGKIRSIENKRWFIIR